MAVAGTATAIVKNSDTLTDIVRIAGKAADFVKPVMKNAGDFVAKNLNNVLRNAGEAIGKGLSGIGGGLMALGTKNSDTLGKLVTKNLDEAGEIALKQSDEVAEKLYKSTKNAGGDISKKPIVIGENMDRVKQYADEIGGQVYRPWKNDPFDYDLAMKRNKRWVKDKIKEGREIIDIGPDFSRRSLGRDPSDFYNMERTQTKNYDNYSKVFERNGSLSGGVSGLDY